MCKTICTIGPLTLHGYGLMIAIGVVIACLWACKRADSRGLVGDKVIDLVLIIVIGGFGGGKLLFIITEWQYFLQDPFAVLGAEGFVVYGGVVSSIVLVMLYCMIRKMDFPAYLDVLMAPVALGQAFGRLGCFMAGCCYGSETNSILGVVFPAGSSAPAGIKLWPAQLFSSAGDVLLMLSLLLIEKKCKKLYKGDLLLVYLMFYGIGRFCVEFFRNDPRGAVGIFSTSQFISLMMVPLALAVFLYRHRKTRSNTINDSETAADGRN